MKVRAIVLSAIALAVLLPFHNCAPAGDSSDGNSTLAFEYSPISLKVASGSSARVDEGQSTQLEVEIYKTQPVDLKLIINLTQSGMDLQLPVSEITLPANQKSVKFTVSALTDAAIEADENASIVVMYKDAPAPTGTGPLALTIADKSPVPALTLSAITVQEGMSANLVVHAAYAIVKDITFDLQITNGTAVSADYQVTQVAAIKIPAGQTSVNVAVKALADASVEANETFSVKLINVQFATAPVAATMVTISDNTVLPTLSVAAATATEGKLITFRVMLSAPSKYPTEFDFKTENGTGVAGVNYTPISGTLTIPAGQQLALISVQGKDDGLHNPNLNFKLKIAVISGAVNASASALGTFIETLKCDTKNVIKLASAFGPQMVLHEDMPRIWGTARPNTDVLLSLKGRAGSAVKVRADASGKFKGTIPLNNIAKGATEIQIKNICEEDKVVDVLIGEVWLCSGQSNMQFAVNSSSSKAEVTADIATDAVKTNIRLFNVALNKTATELHELPAVTGRNKWTRPDLTSAAAFSAVCWYFGRELQKKLNKPIGLINSSYGGTRIEEWIDKTDLPAKYHMPASMGRINGGTFNAMIAPLIPLKISGVAWYQGESNRGHPSEYESLMKYWTASWRKDFLNTVLDFHMVGMASQGVQETAAAGAAVPALGGMASIRQAQFEFADADAHVTVANAIGTTTAAEQATNDIHPKNKKTVGERLARVALTKTYAYPETMPQWDVLGTTDAGNAVRVKVKFPLAMALPAVNQAFIGFQYKSGSGFKYATSAKVISSTAATGVVVIEVKAPAMTGEVRFQMHESPRIGYRTPVNADPLYPLCVKKNGTKWERCDLSYL